MPRKIKHADFVLIGGGIMSATLAILLHEKFPSKQIAILERLPKVAEESSEAWNNAGTGHCGNCELNYTPEVDGSIDCDKAIRIAKQFQESLDFWKHCAAKGYIQDLAKCLRQLPHLSFVEEEENVAFLEKRYTTMKELEPFRSMQFSTNHDVIKKWVPLMMEGRNTQDIVAATFIEKGYDVNFGEIVDQIFYYFTKHDNIDLHLESDVHDLEQVDEGRWLVDITDETGGDSWKILTNYVFNGAGGGALPLLDNSGIQEGKGYGGFPISGLFLRCINPDIIERHDAKVYGKAKEGSPPMSVPHLDTRMINGRKELLYGPFAGFSTKFLKHGSYFDLPRSIEWDNILSLLGAGYHNLPLVKYLVQQVALSFEDRMEMLREFYPNAQDADWKVVTAGQRVQIIKADEEKMGKLQFGTEVIVSEDKTFSCLLGASPGASTSYSILKKVMADSFI